MDINYELYKVFYQVATTLSFSEASRHLYISQSAVSQSIKTLEKKLGQQLFYRNTKKVQLSDAGNILLKHIEPAMNLIARGEEQVLHTQNAGFGQLHIGASDTICRYFLVPYLKHFHEQYPNVSIKVTNSTSLGCVDLLTLGKVDCIITNFPNTALPHSYVQKTLVEFQDVFLANQSFSQLKEKQLTLEELKKYPLLMLERNSTTSEFLHQLFLQHHLELLPEIELSSNDLLIDLAKIGLGIAFVPDYCLQKNTSDLFVVHTKEKLPSRQLVAAINPSLLVSSTTEAFLTLLPTLE